MSCCYYLDTLRLDASFLPWTNDLRTHLLATYPLPAGQEPIPENVFVRPKWNLAFYAGPHEDPHNAADQSGENGTQTERDSTKRFRQGSGPPSELRLPGSGVSNGPGTLRARLVENARLTPVTHWQDVRHLTLVTSSQVEYEPGDTLTIFPKNFEEDVDHFLSLMGWTSIADEPVHFKPTLPATDLQAYPPPTIPNITSNSRLTVRSLLLSHLDITAIPRRTFFSQIAHFTTDQMHKERLLEFTNPEYLDELYDYTTRPRRSILEVLQEFQSVKIPWQWMGSVLPVLRGRQFSIASGGVQKSAERKGTKFHLVVAIVKYRTVIKKTREGVCTRYVAALPEGAEIDVLLQRGGLHITKAEAKRPVVMVGPGTGVAPMRSLIWERWLWAQEMSSQNRSNGHGITNGHSSSIGESILFYGCRNRNADYFYGNEWEDLKNKMGLQVFTAFSRDQKQKVYVQDLIRDQAVLVYRLLHQQSGIIYICGSSGRMPQAVREALIEVFEKGGLMERAAAESYLLTMEKEGRYKQETW